tara:strand:- start:956 stop:1681 length:726 start_codon:yes stop_codon:yes gene_type:complete
MNKCVNSLWIGKRLLPINIISINSFLKNGFKYNLYVYEEVENIPNGVSVLDANVIRDESEVFYYRKGFSKGSPAGFANLFRYTLLYEVGGVWVDTDTVLLKDFKIDGDFIFTSQLQNTGEQEINLALIYVNKPKEDIFKECIEESMNVDKNNIRHGDTGPVLFNYKVREFDLLNYVQPVEKFCPIHWFELFNIVDPTYKLPEESVSIHLWQSRWKYDGLNEYEEYDENCIYEQLKKEYLEN